MQKYKGYNYFKDTNGLWKVLIKDSQFIVALDDSKINSTKRIIVHKNNELTCKEYIDWLNK